MKGGQGHRLPEIPIKTSDGKPLLIMNNHGKIDEKFAQDIKYSSSTYCGTAGSVLASFLAGKVQAQGSLAVRKEMGQHLERLRNYWKALIYLRKVILGEYGSGL